MLTQQDESMPEVKQLEADFWACEVFPGSQPLEWTHSSQGGRKGYHGTPPLVRIITGHILQVAKIVKIFVFILIWCITNLEQAFQMMGLPLSKLR